MKCCKRCGRNPLDIRNLSDGSIVVNLLNRGREQWWMRCGCGGRTEYFNEEERGQLWPHEYDDRRCKSCGGHGCNECSPACQVFGCKTPYQDIERHHIAPVAIFGAEANDWPLIMLCKHHHREWHERTQIAKPHQNHQDAAELALDLAQRLFVFSVQRTPYKVIATRDNTSLDIRSQEFKDILFFEYYKQFGTVPRTSVINRTIEYLVLVLNQTRD
jgi:hypothetical protein